MKRGGPLARRTPLLPRRPWRTRTPRTPPADPLGPRQCYGPERGAPGDCWGALHRHHVVRRSQGGTDQPGNLLWLCAGHHAWTHDHPADAKTLGLLA